MTCEPFRIEITDQVLDDLRLRLRRTRFTTASDSQPWQAGVDPGYLRELAAYWSDDFDWRQVESALNALPHFLGEIAGRQVHFIHLKGAPAAGASALPPLLLSHGWPSSFVEMLPLARRLANPADFGSDPAQAFDVVVPSLPGFLYSELPDGPLTRPAIAETLHTLMTDLLGYRYYGAFGGDIGGGATQWLGALHPEHVVGIHLIHPAFPASFNDPPVTPQEQRYLNAVEAYDKTDGGYSAIMITRPDTIAAALIDSPAGLVAWIIDKWRDWSDCDGDLEHRFSRDTLLTIATLYWATGTIGTSFRQYYNAAANPPRPTITVPAAFTMSREPLLAGFPRQIAERACSDIRHWSEPQRGGHFMPIEEPDLLAAEMRHFFASLPWER